MPDKERLTGWRADLLALLAGACLPLAFAPFAISPLALLSPGVLFWLWLEATPGVATRYGYLFGLGLFGVGISWVYVAIHDFGYTSAPLAVLLTAIFVAFLALCYALLGYVSARLLQRCKSHERFQTIALVVILPALWVLFEWLRGWIFTGFPWLNLGYSQIDTPLAGLAPWLGVYGITWAVALSAGLLLLCLRNPARRTWGITILALLWSGAWLVGKVEWTKPIDKPITVRLIQGNVPQMTKWDPKQFKERLDRYGGLTRENWDSQLIIWPENAITVFYQDIDVDFFEPLIAEAKKTNTDLIIGLPTLNPETDQYYSSLMSLGATPGVYNKRHLVPFGEFIPLESVLRGLIRFFDLPMSGFSRGAEDQPLLVAAGQPIATSICYEDAFGEEVIRSLPKATILVNGSNNAWYGNSLAPHQHLQISRMRALETGRMLLRATTNGISAIIDHHGELLQTAPQFKAHVIKGEVQPRQGATLYVKLGNWTVVVGLFIVLGLVWLMSRREDDEDEMRIEIRLESRDE